MNFTIKPSKQKETVATTPKGNTIRYAIVPEEKMKFWKPNPELSRIDILSPNESDFDILGKDNKEYKAATRIRIDCSFYVDMKMIDLLESSKIFSIDFRGSETKNDSFILIIPHPLFDYEKLNDILFDLCKKYDL